MGNYEYLLKCELDDEREAYMLYLPSIRKPYIACWVCKEQADAFFPTLKNAGENVSVSLKQLGPAAKWPDYEWVDAQVQNKRNVLAVYIQMQVKSSSGLEFTLYAPSTDITGRRPLNAVWVSPSFVKRLPPWLTKLQLDEVIEAELRLRRAG